MNSISLILPWHLFYFDKIFLGKANKAICFEYNLSGHGEEADVEAGQPHLQAYQLIWNRRKLIGKRASSMESDIYVEKK
jgi:hypothetical protein